MDQIMIVEDDPALNQGLCKALKDTGRQIVSCENIRDARQQILLGSVSLVLLDINLPDGNGLDFMQEIKGERPFLPVILLTANDTDKDVVTGLELGADDYITKPFSLSVLKARVGTQLRKLRDAAPEELFTDEGYSFDYQKMIFSVNGEAADLSKTEQKLLRILTENAPNTVSRETLIDRIWSDGSEYVDENALSVTVKRLRTKLSAQDKIKTVYGIGYAWMKKNE